MFLETDDTQVEVIIGRRQYQDSTFMAKARLVDFSFSLNRKGECSVLINTEVVLCSLQLDAPDECGPELVDANFKPKPVPLVADNSTLVSADFSRPDGHGEIVGVRYVNPATDTDWLALVKRCQESDNQYALQGNYFKEVGRKYPVIVLSMVRDYMLQAVKMGKYA
ncbi:MAG: hypothetical protein ACRYFX_08700 [Janthinobacterium lividum]